MQNLRFSHSHSLPLEFSLPSPAEECTPATEVPQQCKGISNMETKETVGFLAYLPEELSGTYQTFRPMFSIRTIGII